MMYFKRSDPPQELLGNYVKWNTRFVERREESTGAVFSWNQVDGQPINQILVPIMVDDTDGHCSYCDNFPLHRVDRTIDHFLPKSSHPDQAYTWKNLYLSCMQCQDEKNTTVSPDLLRPDEDGYNFNDYFIIDFTLFSLEPNPLASANNQLKAGATIQILNLNSWEYRTARRQHHERVRKAKFDINDFPFRYLFR